MTHATLVESLNWIAGVSLTLCLACSGHAAEATKESPSKVAESIAGDWTAVPEVQGFFDRLSSAPTSLGGVVEHVHIELMEPEKIIGGFKDLKLGEQRLKKSLADANHIVIGGGHLSGSVKERPLAYLDEHFLLTQCDGETFISALIIDAAEFMPQRIHRIPGKKRSDDVLIVEFGSATHNQICVLRRGQAVAPAPPK
jgi:hypothetical protein